MPLLPVEDEDRVGPPCYSWNATLQVHTCLLCAGQKQVTAGHLASDNHRNRWAQYAAKPWKLPGAIPKPPSPGSTLEPDGPPVALSPVLAVLGASAGGGTPWGARQQPAAPGASWMPTTHQQPPVAPGGMTRTAAAAVQPPVTPGGTTRSSAAAAAIDNVMNVIDELICALADLRSQLVDSTASHQTSDGGDDMPSMSSGVSNALEFS